MNQYRITCPVESVKGEQFFLVDAESKEDAIAKHRAGQSQFEGENVEVYELGTPRAELAEEEP